MADDSLLIILGNQLFPIEEIKKLKIKKVFMKEDLGLCTDFKHHKLKILFFLGAMREYKKDLESNGIEVIYHDIDKKLFARIPNLSDSLIFEIEDKRFV